MEHYRDLNKEMVQEIQTMRLNLRLYYDEIVSLKAELLRRRENEISLRKKLNQLIVGNCLQLTEILDPDADFLPVLKQSVTNLNRSTSQPDSTYQPSNSRRRSNHLSAELRRSSSIINTRNSIRSTSPIPRRSSGVTDEENTQTIQNIENEHTAENDSEVDPEHESRKHTANVTEEQRIEVEGKVAEEQRSPFKVIYEDSDGERTVNEMTEEESSQEVVLLDTDNDDDDGDESVEGNSMNASCASGILKDVTNLSSTAMDLTCDKEKSMQTLDKSISFPKVGRKRSSKNALKSTNCSASDTENRTLQEPRRSARNRELKMTNISIPTTTQYYNTSGEDAAIVSFNFHEASSSTPNSRKVSSSSSHCAKESLTPSISTRPVRQCRPKNMTEPTLKTKIRNEALKTTVKNRKKRK